MERGGARGVVMKLLIKATFYRVLPSFFFLGGWGGGGPPSGTPLDLMSLKFLIDVTEFFFKFDLERSAVGDILPGFTEFSFSPSGLIVLFPFLRQRNGIPLNSRGFT